MNVETFGKALVMAPCCDIVEIDWVLFKDPNNKLILKLESTGLGIDWAGPMATQQANWVKAQLFNSVPFMAQIPARYREVLEVSQLVEPPVADYFTIAEGQYDPEAHKFHFKLSGKTATLVACGIVLTCAAVLAVTALSSKN